ncbi:uncharacterized protein LAESUDRAFT_737657 [Laetiporus sulphureus 93-53]|uniref:Uncharacterized protein n=1 Tax=Laetiporus sulphureus 93-53 TaxID=1314785 RepID=A0A165DKQ8_9APHY|nr:uncharacterized protein LAESUDRAFT_737657 [Laetiporus sulphureus 93-53]KZT05098.1 hypothetical protein LAESUDRAFT_737657 [Laetiporus sulphureus 93-53]
MESLNLNILANSLPPSNLANAEKDLTNNFKAAALALTTLYRSSRRTSKRAYNAGYATACQDLLLMIQQGVSAGDSSDSTGHGMTIGRIMDYIEARLEAIKSREEEEDEDEEKERERAKPTATASNVPLTGSAAPRSTGAKPSGGSVVPAAVARRADVVSTSTLMALQCPDRHQSNIAPLTPDTSSDDSSPLVAPLSPSRPSIPHLPQSFPLGLPLQRTSKNRFLAISNANPKEPPTVAASFPFPAPSTAVLPPPPSAGFHLPTRSASPGLTPSLPHPSSESTVGTKRRHNMMLDSSAPTTASETPSSSSIPRRRTRSARVIVPQHQDQNQNHVQGSDAMDVEEEGGRERKRVARR